MASVMGGRADCSWWSLGDNGKPAWLGKCPLGALTAGGWTLTFPQGLVPEGLVLRKPLCPGQCGRGCVVGFQSLILSEGSFLGVCFKVA